MTAPPTPGVHLDGDAATFVVWAAYASRVDLVIGEAQQRHPMSRVGDTIDTRELWTVTVPGVTGGTRYGYSLDGGPVRPDPRTRHQPDGVHRMSAVETAPFDWRHDFPGVPLRDLVIYELHVGTFTPEGTLDAAIGQLADLAELGVNAIELLPVSQFPGDRGWGYDGVHPFAVQNTYGGPAALRRLVDAAHGMGLAVLMDCVYNHFGPEGNYLPEFGPYLTGRIRTPWGDGLNVDSRGCDEVRRFIVDNVRLWIDEFRLDGLRLDAIQTIVDVSARHILADIAAAAHEIGERDGREVVIIGETDQHDVRIVTPPAENGLGLDAIWNDDFHHAVHALVTGERDTYYADFHPPYTTPAAAIAEVARKVYSRDGRFWHGRGHRAGAPAGETDRKRFVIGIQNHDQTGNRAYGERLHRLCEPAAYRLAAGLMLLSNQTPMLFQGEEYAEPAPFCFFCDFQDPALNDAVRRGRAREYWPEGTEWTDDMPDPPRRRTFERSKLSWDWSDPDRAAVRTLYQTLLRLRRQWPLEEPVAAALDGPVLRLDQGNRRVLANLSAEPAAIDAVDATLSTEQPKFGGTRAELGGIDQLRPWELIVPRDNAHPPQ